MTLGAAIRNRLVIGVFPFMFRVTASRDDLIRVGTSYGGWWIPDSVLQADSVCICAGVGTDISFDRGIIEKFGCRVWGVDPTPKSIAWVSHQLDVDSRFTLVPLGLAGESGDLKFYEPSNPDHVSHSTKNIQKTSDYFTARVVTVSQLLLDLGLDRIDLIKLDIEGAEHDTIREMLSDGIHPSIVCVEFDQPEPLRWGRATVRALLAADYDLVKVDCLNLTFVSRGQ